MTEKVKINLNLENFEKELSSQKPFSTATITAKMKTTVLNNEKGDKCIEIQKCKNEECVENVGSCAGQNNINQSTMLIMVIVGLTIIIFLIILYCLQQRGRNRIQSLSESHTDHNSSTAGENTDNLSLYQPPPAYEEVMSTSIYPNTRFMHQRVNSFTLNVPQTPPPPNYDAALNILARSQEMISSKPTLTLQTQTSIRRCQSEEILTPNRLPEASIFNFSQIR